MDVGVGQSVDDQRPGRDIAGSGDQVRLGVALRVLLRGFHVALGIYGVVVLPVGGRGAGHAAAEGIGRVDQGV